MSIEINNKEKNMTFQIKILACLVPLVLFNTRVFAYSASTNDFTLEVKVQRGIFKILTNNAEKTYSVDCQNDGVWEAKGVTGSYSCHLPTKGNYTVRLRDTSGTQSAFSNITFTGGTIVAVSQWGDQKWVSFNGFHQASSLISLSAPDAPDLLNVKGTKYTRFFDGDLSIQPTEKTVKPVVVVAPAPVLKVAPKVN